MPYYDDPYYRRRARPEMGMTNYPGRGSDTYRPLTPEERNRISGRTGEPADPIRPVINRPDLAPGYVPHPPPSRVITRPPPAPPPTTRPTGPSGQPYIPMNGPSGLAGGYGALHINPPISHDPYADPNRDPRSRGFGGRGFGGSGFGGRF